MIQEQQADGQANAPVEGDPGVVQVGESLTSFDQLEAIESNVKAEARAEAVKEAAVEEAKDEIKGKDAKEPEGEQVEQEASAEEPAEEAEAGEEVVEEPEVDAKVFKALRGEEEVELPGDAVVPVTIDGEEVEMTLEEIVAGTSGQEAIRKRFGEIGTKNKQLQQERAKWEQERQIFDQRLKTTVQLLEKNPLAGIASIAEMSGVKDTEKYMGSFVASLIQSAEQMANMTESERKMHEQSILTEQKAARLEARETALNSKATQQEVAIRKQQVQAVHGIDDETFRDTFVELEQLQKQGAFAHEITPEFVANVVVQDRQEEKIKGVVQTVRPSLLEDRDSLKDLVETLLVQDPKGELEDDDIKDIILQAFPNSGGTDESLSRKVKKSGAVKKVVKQQGAVNPSTEPVSFDDLDY